MFTVPLPVDDFRLFHSCEMSQNTVTENYLNHTCSANYAFAVITDNKSRDR